MRFLDPRLGAWWLLGLAVVALLQWRWRRRFAASTMVRWLGARRYRASIVRKLPLLLLAASLGLIGVALMRPVLPFSQSEVQSHGLDLVVVLDLSSSMEEEMEPPPVEQLLTPPLPGTRPPGKTRLQATKDAIRAFIRSRRDDRIGLVVFSDNAYVVSPLTFDYDYLLRYVDMADDRILEGEGQTAIGEGIGLATYLLSRQARATRGHQAIVLFTDGENNRGRDPISALAEAQDAGIRVHFVGVSLEDEVRRKRGVAQLLAAVRRGGGQYFNANTAGDLLAASRAIDAVETGFLVTRVSVRDAPVYQWFAIPALLCLLTCAALRGVPDFVDHT